MEYVEQPLQALDFVREYYCQRRSVDGVPVSIYQIWEKGGAYNDSVTPSSYSPEYRSHMVLKLLSLTRDDETIFSIGCGNGFIEGEVFHCRRDVRAMDYNEEAVRLTAKKGVHAFQADFFDLPPASLSDVALVYADGLLGHVFQPGSGLTAFVEKLRTLAPPSGAWIVLSNDGPRDSSVAFCPHDHLRDFWYLSKSYLAESFDDAGFRVSECYQFPYVRPLSGLRLRTICVAQVR